MAKVRAISRGYVGLVLREAGDVFEWPEGQKLGSWVKPFKADLGEAVAVQDADEGKGKKGKAKGKAETVEAPTAAPFADAPEPEIAKGNGVEEALGGPAPDWLPPSETGDI